MMTSLLGVLLSVLSAPTGIVVDADPLSVYAASVSDAPRPKPVLVIRVAFVTATPPCPVDFNPDADGLGTWYMGAPCQRMLGNPLHPECWAPEDDEDPCVVFLDQGWLTINGNCSPNEPCQIEYAFTVEFVEPCVPPCDQVKCCKSGTMKFTQGPYYLGLIFSGGGPKDFSAIDSCSCSELTSSTCSFLVNVQCHDFGPYFYLLFQFGYSWRCLHCG